MRIKYLCEDLDVLRRRLKDLARDIERKLDDHEVGKLLTTIDGVGPLTTACLIAELRGPARFRSAAAIASYVSVGTALRDFLSITQSYGDLERFLEIGKRHIPMFKTPLGNRKAAQRVSSFSSVNLG